MEGQEPHPERKPRDAGMKPLPYRIGSLDCARDDGSGRRKNKGHDSACPSSFLQLMSERYAAFL